MVSDSRKRFERRGKRTRYKLRLRGKGRPRLSVFRSGKNIYAQVIDDARGLTLAAAATMEKELRGTVKSGATREAAAMIGTLIAERARARGVEEVVFDRGGYLFHGRVKALAESARVAGLKF